MRRSQSFHFGFFSALEIERRSAPARHKNKVEDVLLKRKIEQLNRERRLSLNDMKRAKDKLKTKQRELPPPLSLYQVYDDDVCSEDSGYNSEIATAAARSTTDVKIHFEENGENIPVTSSCDRGRSSGYNTSTDISRPGSGLPPITSPDPLARCSPESSRREERTGGRPDDYQQGGLKEERSSTTHEEVVKGAETGNTGTNVANMHTKQTAVDIKSADHLTVGYVQRTSLSTPRQVHQPKIADADIKSNQTDSKEHHEEVLKEDTKTPPYSFSPIERLRLSRHTAGRKLRHTTSQISGKNSDKPGIYSSAYITQPPIWKISLQELSPEFRKIAFGRRTKRKDAFAKNLPCSDPTQSENEFQTGKRKSFMYAGTQARPQEVQPSSYRTLAKIQVLKTSALDRKWPEEKDFVKEVLKERKSWNLEKQLRDRVVDFLKKDHYVSTDSLKKDEVEENLEKLQKILSTK